MALASGSSLRPLVLFMSRRKPRLSSFFSSSNPTAIPRLGSCTPAAPAVQPPADPALADCSSHKCPPHEELVLHPLPDPPKKGNTVIGKSSPSTLEKPERPVILLCTVDEDPEHLAPDCCSYSSMPGPVSCSDNPGPKNSDGVGHPIPDPPIRTGNTALDKPSLSTPGHPDHLILLLCTVDEDPEQPTPDDGGGSYSSTDKPRLKPSQNESVQHPIPDPPGHHVGGRP